MKRFNSLGNRVIAFTLSILIVLGMLPGSVFAMDSSELTTDIGEKNFVVGETMEFTFTTTANGDADTYVLGTFQFSDPDAVEKLEYLEAQSGTWYEFDGDFNPTGTGFPMADGTSQFRVTFNKEGNYTVTASMVRADNREVLCSVTENVTVARVANPSVLTTTIGDTAFTVGQTAEFTFTTTANDDAGTYVLGTFQFSDPDAIEKLEYLEAQSGTWYEFDGDFNPTGTGFPMADGTSQFRVTFNKEGNYTVTASMVRTDNREVLCSVTKTVAVAKGNPSVLTTTMGDSFTVGQTAEFTFTTTANDDAGTYVLGTFQFSDPDAVEKLEYLEAQSGTWYEFYGDFGPADTGFPMTDATSQFRVTFGKAGSYTLTVSMKAVADGSVLCSLEKNITVGTADLGDFHFANTNPSVTYAPGLTYSANENALVGGDDTVTFAIISGEDVADIDAATGVLTIKKAGTVVVRATRPADSAYSEATAEYTLTVNKAQQTGFGFGATDNATVTFNDNNNQYTVKAEGGQTSGAVTYAITSGDAATMDENGVLTITKAGTVVIEATKAGDDCYEAAAATFTLTINKAQQTGFGFGETDNATVTYNDNGNQYTVKAEGGQTSGAVTYTITSGDAATVDANGVITITKAGTVLIEAAKAGDDCYEAAAATFTLTINKAQQTGFGFGETDNATIAFSENGTYTVKAEGGQSSGGITYTITSGEAATVDANGVVTIVKAGTVVIEATKAGDDCYEAVADTFTLTITEAGRTFALADRDVVYGQTTYIDTEIPADVPYSGVTYVVESQNIEATIDDNGRVTLGKLDGEIGTVTVTVTLLADEKYSESKASYTITVRCAEAPEAPYTLEGAKINESGWFTGTVTIKPLDGWKISYTNDPDDANWTDSVTWDTDTNGQDENRAAVYLRNTETGAITDVIPVADLLLDKTAPEGITINCDISIWQKILGALFGYKDSSVKVVVDASDKMSGIAKIECSIDGGTSYTEVSCEEGEYEFYINAQYRGQLYVKVTDVAGNVTVYENVSIENGEVLNKIVVVDDTLPGLTISCTSDGTINKDDNGNYDSTGNKVAVEIGLSDENLDLFAADHVVKVNGEVQDGWVSGENSETLTFELTEEGDYSIVIEYQDLLNAKKITHETKVRIDRTAPVIVTNITNNESYTEDLDFVLTITEHNFDADKVDLKVMADGVAVADFAANGKWSHEGDVHTLTVTGLKDAYYEVTVNYTDDLGLTAVPYSTSFTLDRVAPAEPTWEYTSDGTLKEVKIGEQVYVFASGTVHVTSKSSDATSGIATMEYLFQGSGAYLQKDESGNYSFDLKEEGRGQLVIQVTDQAGNITSKTDDKILVIDNTAPWVTVLFDSNNRTAGGDDDHLFYGGAVSGSIEVTEDNFFPEIDSMDIQITCNGEIVTDWKAAGITVTDWEKKDEGVYVRTFQMTNDGDYRISAKYQDRSGNQMGWMSNESQVGSNAYVSKLHTIDTVAPECVITFDNDTPFQTLGGLAYYNKARTATIAITERNFVPENAILMIECANAAGEMDYTHQVVWEQKGDTWTAKIPFDFDAEYNVEFSYTDPANHEIEPYSTSFVVDTSAPDGLRVDYKSKSAQWVNTILDAITFGHHNAAQEVVLTMNDATAGIEYIKLTVTPEGTKSATTLKMPKDLVLNADGTKRSGEMGFITKVSSSYVNGKLVLSFDVPANFRGKVNFVAYDKSGNFKGSGNDGVLVVDTIAPNCNVTYNPSNVVSAADGKDISFNAADGVQDTAGGKAAYVMYFSAAAEATISIKEANFDPSQVAITVLDASGNAVQGWVQTGWETTNGDNHTTKVKIAADGDYQIEVYYMDYAQNTAVNYLSQRIVVDMTAPVINVEYTNKDVKNSINGRDYFSKDQAAIITITERNFRAEDTVVVVEAKDVTGKNVNYELKVAWEQKDDSWIAEIPFNVDANYTFDIECQDLAKNKAADYAKDLFTVDKTPPTGLTITYKTDVAEQILQALTFGYYNAKVTVTITAEDDISGIYHFAYSYIKAENVSDVNAELLNQAINEAEIRYSNNGKTATATFSIPKDVLGEDNQFNGNVEFTAYNRSELSKEEIGDTIVVDNIRPTAQITYNAPVKNVNGISYYNGNIHATLRITEANFDSEAVHVTATKDGAAYPVHVVWDEEKTEGDTHTGTFVLTNEGDYTVTVNYTDKSLNQMVTYVSNQLTLDTTAPTIKVSDIKANSANKDEKYGFVITFDDINLDVAAMKPVLKAVKRTEGDVYEVVEIDLGESVAVVNNQTYTYTVEDIPEDGLYTLVCEVADMSGNTMSQIVLDDNKTYNEVQFSINRDGSTFGYGNKFSEELVSQYYIYSVTEDIVILEVNVDPIETYKVTLNGTELVEGTDYTTEQTSEAGEWSKRTYTINKELFEAEGEYSIIVSSTDKTETTAYSDIKNLSLSFVVDQTAPTLTISGLATGGRYQTDEQTVTLIPTDEGGRLKSLTVIILNVDGQPLTDASGNDISVRFDMDGEELLKYLEENDGKVTFTIPNGLNNQVRIICNDCAVNAEYMTNEYDQLFTRVTVSQNSFVIFYANTPLFIGSIAGGLGLIAAIIVLIKRKKPKAKV